MSRMNRAIIWATVDRARNMALITGKDYDPILREVVPQMDTRWSAAGHGYVVTLAELADLCSLASIMDAIWRERDREVATPHRKGRAVQT